MATHTLFFLNQRVHSPNLSLPNLLVSFPAWYLNFPQWRETFCRVISYALWWASPQLGEPCNALWWASLHLIGNPTILCCRSVTACECNLG